MNYFYSQLRKNKEKRLSGQLGLTLVELLIAMTVAFLFSIGIFQLFKLGYAALSGNASSATKSGFTSTLSTLYNADLAQSNGFIVSSATVPGANQGTQKRDICTTWNSSNVSNYAVFDSKRPLLTIYIKHSTIINNASVSGNLITYYTNSTPDFQADQSVVISGLTSSANTGNFNFTQGDNVVINSVSTAKPYFFTVINKNNAIPDGSSTTPSSTTGNVTANNKGVYTLDSIDGIGVGMSVTYGAIKYTVQDVDPVASTFSLDPSTNAIPVGTNLTFVSTSNGVAETNSFIGYELRSSTRSSNQDYPTELWRVTCQAEGQLIPDAKTSIKLRTDLPPIDTKSNSNCLEGDRENWIDWGCAIKCPQISNSIIGSDYSSYPDVCPTDIYLSSGQRAFVTKLSSATDANNLFLENSNNAASSVQVGMSVNYLGLINSQIRQYITAVDLTDPSGDALITVACISAAKGSNQSTLTCPTPPQVGTQIIIGASFHVLCVSATSQCSLDGSNTLGVSDSSLLEIGMYIDLGTGFGVLGDTSGGTGSQNVTFSQLPKAYSLPKVLEFYRPVGVQIWIPWTAPNVSGVEPVPEQKITAGRATA